MKGLKEIENVKFLHMDGIRGLASLVVVIAHLLAGFYPGLYFYDPSKVHNVLETTLIKMPMISLAYAGNFAVCIFFVMSAFVLTQSFLKARNRSFLISICARRYIRLVLPVIITSLIGYTVLKFGGFYNQEAGAKTKSLNWLSVFFRAEPDFINTILESVYYVFKEGKREYNPVIWTMQVELLGSLLVFGVMWVGRYFVLRYVLYIGLIAIFYDSYYLCFITGMVFYEMDVSGLLKVKGCFFRYFLSLIIIVVFFLSIFLGSYTNNFSIEINRNIYVFLQRYFSNPFQSSHVIGASLFVFAVNNQPFLKKFFSLSLFLYLGRISFSLYLLHMILLGSLMSYLFFQLYPSYTYNEAFLLASTFFLVALLLLSHFVCLFVDRPGIRFSRFCSYKLDSVLALVFFKHNCPK